MSELNYNPETGSFTLKTTNRRGFVGKQAGCFCPRDGYIRIRIHKNSHTWEIRTGAPVGVEYVLPGQSCWSC